LKFETANFRRSPSGPVWVATARRFLRRSTVFSKLRVLLILTQGAAENDVKSLKSGDFGREIDFFRRIGEKGLLCGAAFGTILSVAGTFAARRRRNEPPRRETYACRGFHIIYSLVDFRG